jgi:hypothetical protein
MSSSARRRFWFEVAIAATSLVLCLITFAVPDWIERLGGAGGDAGSGGTERAFALVFLAAAAIFAALARVEYRRSPSVARGGER